MAIVKAYLSSVLLILPLRLDYCISLYVGLEHPSLRLLLLLQNAAACLLTGKSNCDHITEVLASLHWLTVCPTIDYKRGDFTLSSWTSAVSALRSTSQRPLDVPRTSHKNWGHRAFAAAAPALGSSSPIQTKTAQTLEIFESLLLFLFVAFIVTFISFVVSWASSAFWSALGIFKSAIQIKFDLTWLITVPVNSNKMLSRNTLKTSMKTWLNKSTWRAQVSH